MALGQRNISCGARPLAATKCAPMFTRQISSIPMALRESRRICIATGAGPAARREHRPRPDPRAARCGADWYAQARSARYQAARKQPAATPQMKKRPTRIALDWPRVSAKRAPAYCWRAGPIKAGSLRSSATGRQGPLPGRRSLRCRRRWCRRRPARCWLLHRFDKRAAGRRTTPRWPRMRQRR